MIWPSRFKQSLRGLKTKVSMSSKVEISVSRRKTGMSAKERGREWIQDK